MWLVFAAGIIIGVLVGWVSHERFRQQRYGKAKMDWTGYEASTRDLGRCWDVGGTDE